MAYLHMVLMLKALSVNIERVWSSLLASSASVMAVSSARFMVCLSGCDFISICIYGRLGPWVDFGCSQDGVACDKGAVCVDVFVWVPRHVVRADMGWVVRGSYHGYGRVGVLACLPVVE